MAKSFADLKAGGARPKDNAIDMLVKRHIEDQKVHESVRGRAKAFEVEGTGFQLTIVEDLVFDLGGIQPTDSLVMAQVRSNDADLLHFLEKKTGLVNVVPDQVHAAFVIFKRYDLGLSRKLKTPAFRYHEFLLTHVSRRSETTVIVMGELGWNATVLSSQRPTGNKTQRAMSEILGAPNTRYYGLHSYVPVYGRGKWWAARYTGSAYLPTTIRNSDRFVQSVRIEVGMFEAISENPLTAARLLGLALNRPVARPQATCHCGTASTRDQSVLEAIKHTSGQRNLPSRKGHRPVDRLRAGHSGLESYCEGACLAATLTGMSASGGVGKSCIQEYGAGAAELCGLLGLATGAVAIGGGLVCAIDCELAFGPSPGQDPFFPGDPPIVASSGDGDGTGDGDDDDGDGDGDDGDGDDDGSGEDGYGDAGDDGGEGGGGNGGDWKPGANPRFHPLATVATTDPWG
jgi:hypothetical protein